MFQWWVYKYKTFIIDKLVGDYKYRPIQNILVMNSDKYRPIQNILVMNSDLRRGQLVNNSSTSQNMIFSKLITQSLWEKKTSDGQQFHQSQQKGQPPLILTRWTFVFVFSEKLTFNNNM